MKAALWYIAHGLAFIGCLVAWMVAILLLDRIMRG